MYGVRYPTLLVGLFYIYIYIYTRARTQAHTGAHRHSIDPKTVKRTIPYCMLAHINIDNAVNLHNVHKPLMSRF
jgi:hypothetical protein